MKILKHGIEIVFVCPKCRCEFSEFPRMCYSSTDGNGGRYCMACPDCGNICWTSDTEQKGRGIWIDK